MTNPVRSRSQFVKHREQSGYCGNCGEPNRYQDVFCHDCRELPSFDAARKVILQRPTIPKLEEKLGNHCFDRLGRMLGRVNTQDGGCIKFRITPKNGFGKVGIIQDE